jgi:predicted ribosome quality control (RQC) complex YloA/Tae2 family protein
LSPFVFFGSWFVMDNQTIQEIVTEIAPLLEGRGPGKIFQFSPLSLAIDFRSRDKKYLLISAEPNQPRLHMIGRRVSDLEKRSLPLSQFAQALKSELSQTQLQSIAKDASDRIVRFAFVGQDELGQKIERTLIAQLTGRAANLFVLDDNMTILRALRPGRGPGQLVGETYEAPPSPPVSGTARQTKPLEKGSFETLSDAADAYYHERDAATASDTTAAGARSHLRKQISQREKLQQQLERDLATHADAEDHKRIGDLLLANTNAKRSGDLVQLIDYFAEGEPVIDVSVDQNSTLPEEAARRFARFAKSKRARQEIKKRLDSLKTEIDKLHTQQATLEQIIAGGDQDALAKFIASSSSRPASAPGAKRKPDEKIAGVRRYLSADGYEILVGRAARDNDHLTFKVAKPYDLWLHAADYPGSHVIVRNPTRKEIPHRTIIEAAQLTAWFSHAREDTKVPVHYTQRKFLSKPKGAAPGLVRMSSFKTITVEPQQAAERL